MVKLAPENADARGATLTPPPLAAHAADDPLGAKMGVAARESITSEITERSIGSGRDTV